MSNKKRTVLTVLALVLVCALSIAGTLAYLTDKTSDVKNTFAAAGLADVFTLDETEALETTGKPGTYTLPDPTKRTQANSYENIVPGVDVPKDPVITIEGLGTNAYLFVKVKDTLPTGLSWDITSGWTELTNPAGVAAGEKVYYRELTPNDYSLKLIDNDLVTVATNYNPDNGNNSGGLDFIAYLVQKEGLSLTEAWANRQQ